MNNIVTLSISYLLNSLCSFLMADPIIYFVGIILACYVIRFLFNILHIFIKGV